MEALAGQSLDMGGSWGKSRGGGGLWGCVRVSLG